MNIIGHKVTTILGLKDEHEFFDNELLSYTLPVDFHSSVIRG